MCPIGYHSPTSQNCAVYKHLRFTQTGNSYFKMAAVLDVSYYDSGTLYLSIIIIVHLTTASVRANTSTWTITLGCCAKKIFVWSLAAHNAGSAVTCNYLILPIPFALAGVFLFILLLLLHLTVAAGMLMDWLPMLVLWQTIISSLHSPQTIQQASSKLG